METQLNKVKYTVKQVMSLLGVSKTTVYAWINKNKIEYEETPKGKIILLTEQEIEQLKESYQVYSSEQSTKQFSSDLNSKPEQLVDNVVNSNEVIIEMLTKIDEYHKQSLQYAEQAGKVKLLTDNQTFYQNEYFKVKYEVEQFTKANEQLRNENEQLTTKLEIINDGIKKLEEQIQELKESLENKSLECISYEKQIENLKQELESEKKKPFWKKKAF